MMKILKLIVICLMINYTLNGLILPDPQNPILFYYPFEIGKIKEITVRFQLPEGPGLSQFQYIALNLPYSDEIKFDSKDPGVYLCSLKDSDGVEYAVSADSYEESTAFCQLTDSNPLVGKKSYTLKISLLTDIYFNRSTLNIIKLFTCTSNLKNDYIIIDSNPTFADAGFYPNFFKDDSIVPMLDMEALTYDKTPIMFEWFDFKAEFKTLQNSIKS